MPEKNEKDSKKPLTIRSADGPFLHGTDVHIKFMPTSVEPMAMDLMTRECWPVSFEGVAVTIEDGKLCVRAHPDLVTVWNARKL